MWYGERVFIANTKRRGSYLMRGSTRGGRHVTVVVLPTGYPGTWLVYTAWRERRRTAQGAVSVPDNESFEHLTPEERAVVGDPEDYDWDSPIAPPPARRDRSHFSVRVDPTLYAELATTAERHGVRFSDVVREALETYVGRRQPLVGNAVYSISGASVIVSEARGAWGTPTRGFDPERLDTNQPAVATGGTAQ